MASIGRAQARRLLADALSHRGFAWDGRVGNAVLDASESVGPTSSRFLAEAPDESDLRALDLSRAELESAIEEVFRGVDYVLEPERPASVSQNQTFAAGGDINITDSAVGNVNYSEMKSSENEWVQLLVSAIESHSETGSLPRSQLAQIEAAISEAGLHQSDIAAAVESEIPRQVTRSEQFKYFVQDVAANAAGSALASGLMAVLANGL